MITTPENIFTPQQKLHDDWQIWHVTLCSSPTERFHKPPAASSATHRLGDLASAASILIPPSKATLFATSVFTDKFAMACKIQGKTKRSK
jgi:hypothetical protein